jgi:hypothetical protein
MQSIRKKNKNKISELSERIPVGRKMGYQRFILYKLAERKILMTPSSLKTFLSSGYSSIAEDILGAFDEVVTEMERQESRFQKRMGEIIEGTKKQLADVT